MYCIIRYTPRSGKWTHETIPWKLRGLVWFSPKSDHSEFGKPAPPAKSVRRAKGEDYRILYKLSGKKGEA